MQNELTKSEFWNQAGKAGLLLGLVPIAHMFIIQGMAGISSPFLRTALTFILWALKFGGCIWLMSHFITGFIGRYGEEGMKNAQRYGTAAALCSALLFSGATLANMLVISPDLYEGMQDTVMQAYSSFLDSNSMTMMERMWDKIPQITFFTNLIYCFIYGTVLTAILVRMAAAKEVFNTFKKTEDPENGTEE